MPDIDQMRTQQIMMHGLSKVDHVYTFYHDETNNIRKLHLTDKGFNVQELKVFVLGGVVHEGPPRPIDLKELRFVLRVQKSAAEIKLEHVAKGGFLEILQSEKLTTLFHWLDDAGLMLQYQALDPLYWSVVDIIDSIVPKLGSGQLIQYQAVLKSDLAAVHRANLTATTDLFYRYGYPGLAPEQRKPFLNELIELVVNDLGSLSEFNTMMLKGVLQAGRSLDSLAFIEGNTPKLLIDDFSMFYMNRVAVFKHSSHILDIEEAIKARFATEPVTSAGRPVEHFRFANSKAEAGIQIADVVVGLLGKLYTYTLNTARDEVGTDRDELSGTSLRNAELLRDLITKSDAANIAFINHTSSLHDLDKVDLFLRYHDGAYAHLTA